MALTLTEDQSLIRDSARSFLREKAPVAQLRQLRDSADAAGYSKTLWREFAEMGYAGVLVPEELGGLALGHVEAGILMTEVGRQLCASPLLASGIVATTALRVAGTEAQQKKWLSRLALGEAIATLAVDEAGKHRPDRITTTAAAHVGGWTLNGAKTFVLDGHVADLLIVAARMHRPTAPAEGIALFLVDPSLPGVAIERTSMVDSHNAARIQFQEVQLPTDALLGDANAGEDTLASGLAAALEAGRVGAAAELLGVADEAFERTVAYLKERRQFGKFIGEFQALQHRSAVLYCEIELCRAALAEAQRAINADSRNCADAVSTAKAKAGKVATLAVNEAVQMHGGIGMTDEFDIGLFLKRARVLDELFGDANFHLDARALRCGY